MNNSFATAISEEAEYLTMVETYKDFVKLDIPKMLDNYELLGNEVVIRVFHYDPSTSAAGKFDVKAISAGPAATRTLALAKVLKAGPDARYKAGDIVRLRDFEAATIENPAYKKYVSAVDKRPMGTAASSEEPQRWVSNLANYFQEKIFIINPLKNTLDTEDFFTYKVSDGYISCKIIDPNAFIGA